MRAQELGIGGIVELDVPDALGEKRLDLRPHTGCYLRAEFLARVVDLIGDAIAPEVLGDKPRGDQRHLDVATGDAAQESDFTLGDPAPLLQAAGDYVRRAGQFHHAVRPVPRHLEFLCRNAVEGVDDAGPEVGAPELTVGEDIDAPASFSILTAAAMASFSASRSSSGLISFASARLRASSSNGEGAAAGSPPGRHGT